MADSVQQIKDRLSIVDVISQYAKLERAGLNFKARCPFHAEKTPSFMVSPDRGTYHCFGCGVGGDIFSFVQAIEGLDFKGALKVLADRAGVQLEFRGKREDEDASDRLFSAMEAATLFYQSKLDDTTREYLKKRGLSDETIRTFRLGWAGDGWSDLSDHLKEKKVAERDGVDAGLAKKGERGTLTDKFRNRIMFPISDSAGRVVAFSGRTFGEKAHPEAPKYLNSPETPLFRKSRILYGLDRAKQAIRKHNFAVLVEGQMDLLASHQAGFPNAVAVSGTAFTAEHAVLLKRFAENIVIALDADEAGIKAAGRAARAALATGMNVKVAALPDGLDPADLILQNGADAWRDAIRDAKDVIEFLLDVLEKRSGAPDRFRRMVEAAVLPFLVDVQSPIAREQYARMIAQRLGVSETAVIDALKRVPKEPGMSPAAQIEHPQSSPAAAVGPQFSERARHAFALLTWQKSASKPVLDVASFEAELVKVLGETRFADMHALDADELERLRFLAEKLFGARDSLANESTALLRALKRDRLDTDFAEATAALKRAEAAGNEEEIASLMQKCAALTAARTSL